VAPRFKFRLEQVLDHRSRREDLMRGELAQAMAAVAVQQERAVAAEEAVQRGIVALRSLMEASVELNALRAAHEGLSVLRAKAGHERDTVESLVAIADERRADLVRASQEREALTQLRATAQERHRVEGLRLEGIELDELAMRRAARRPGVAA
jgi:flagellar FliJ protein